jgi:hypothetical protein
VESTQAGIATFGHEPAESAQSTAALAAFRRQLLALIPTMRLPRPPNGA